MIGGGFSDELDTRQTTITARAGNLTAMARQGPAQVTPAEPRRTTDIQTRTNQRTGRLVFLPPDWLPLALLAGDAVIVAASVVLAYWYYGHLDPLHRNEAAT